jgi:anti-sigma regulatory factor (Ser/Thr protein kinase)
MVTSDDPPRTVFPMTNGVHSCLRLPADLAVVSFVRSAFACVLTREEWPADGAGAVLLASSEALTNAIEHGSTARGEVECRLVITGPRAHIRVVDQGRPDSTVPAVPALPPPTTAARGRGLIIISRLADDLTVRPHGRGTEIEMAFLREPGTATVAAAVAA